MRPPALFLAFPSLDAPTCASPIPRLFAPSPACLFCPGSSFRDLRHRRRGRRGEGRPCEARGPEKNSESEGSREAVLDATEGGGGVVDGDVPSNLMTQHHLGRLVAAQPWSSRPNKPILLSGLFLFFFFFCHSFFPLPRIFYFNLERGRIFPLSHPMNPRALFFFFLPSHIPQVPRAAWGLPFSVLGCWWRSLSLAGSGRSQRKDRGGAGPAGPLQCGKGRGKETVGRG